MEGKGQGDLVLTLSLLITQPSMLRAPWPKQLLFIHSVNTPQHFNSALAATQNHKVLVLLLEFLSRVSPSEQRNHMFGVQELKQVKTKDKPPIIRMVWA